MADGGGRVRVASKSSVTFHSRRPFNRPPHDRPGKSADPPRSVPTFTSSCSPVVCYLNGAHPNKTEQARERATGPITTLPCFVRDLRLQQCKQKNSRRPRIGRIGCGKVHPLSVSVTVLFPPLGERATPKRERESCMYECQASAVTRVKVEPKCFSVMIGLSVWFVCSDVTNKPE